MDNGMMFYTSASLIIQSGDNNQRALSIEFHMNIVDIGNYLHTYIMYLRQLLTLEYSLRFKLIELVQSNGPRPGNALTR